MIFLDGRCLPAYTTREFRNYGLHKAGALYKFLFTREDNILLSTGAIKFLPHYMCKFIATHDVMLNGKQCHAGDVINPSDFEESVLKVLIKTNVLRCELSEDFADKDEEFIVKEAQLSDCIGKTFKQASESLGLDFAVVKEKFELKKGATQAKVKQEHLEVMKELLTV